MRVLRTPVLIIRWLAVLAGVLAWLFVVPVADLVKSLLRRVRRT